MVFLSFDDIDDIERILERFTSHWVVVVDTSSTCCEVGELTLATVDGHWCSDVECVWVLDCTDEFVDTDGFDLFSVLFAVGVSRCDDNFSFLSFLCSSKCFFKSRNKLPATNDANHWFVGTALLMSIVFFGDCFTGGLDEIACFIVVEFIINVDNSSVFHSITSLSGSPATVAPLIIALAEVLFTLPGLRRVYADSVPRFYGYHPKQSFPFQTASWSSRAIPNEMLVNHKR